MTKDEMKEYQRIYREENRDHIIELQRQWRQANRDKLRSDSRQYYNSHRDSIATKARESRSAKLNHCVYLIELPNSRMYVGSTNDLTQRQRTHRQEYASKPECPLYTAIRESGGWDQVKIHVLMKDIPDYDLRLRLEQHFIDMIPDHLRLNVRKVQTQKAS